MTAGPTALFSHPEVVAEVVLSGDGIVDEVLG
jgi:hypothetical protein